MIDTYYQSLLNLVAASPNVRSSNLAIEKRGEYVGLIRGDIYFSDDSRLHLRELVNLHGDPPRSMYAYHYQRADNTLIFRYDNTRHHPQLANFPHHKHTWSDATPIFALPDLASVIEEIETLISTKKPEGY